MTDSSWTRLHISTNSQEAIVRLQHSEPGLRHWLARPIIHRARLFSNRETGTEIHWVLRHMRVEGIERADKVDKTTVETPGVRRCAERFVLLDHINYTIPEWNWKEEIHWLWIKYEVWLHTQRICYHPGLDTQGPDKEALAKAATIARRYPQVKPGQAVTGTLCNRIGKRDSNRCSNFTLRTMDVHHVIYNYQAWLD